MTSNNMIKSTVVLYVFLLSATHAFAIGDWGLIPNIVLGIIVTLGSIRIVVKRRFPKEIIKPEDTLIVMALSAIVVSGIVSPNSKTVNYLLAYAFVVIVQYGVLKVIVRDSVRSGALLNANLWGVIATSVFVVADLVAFNIFSVDIQQYISRQKPATATYAGIRRSYGLASEPTILALYYGCMAPIAIWTLWRHRAASVARRISRSIVTILAVVAWLSTFSAAGFASVAVGLIGGVIAVFGRAQWLAGVVAAGLAVVVAAIVILFNPIENVGYLSGIVQKITLDSDASSVRLQLWHDAIDNIVNEGWFGEGIGALASEGKVSSINWYLFLAREAGMLPVALFLGFFIVTYIRIVKGESPGKFAFATGLVAGVVHLATVSGFYYPFVWVLIVLFHLVESETERSRYSVAPKLSGEHPKSKYLRSI